MEEFYLFDENRIPIPIKEGFPDSYLKNYGFPGSAKYHAIHNKSTLLFQSSKVGDYEIVNSNYFITGNGKLEARSNAPCLELHFLLTGQVQIKLKGLDWDVLEEGSHKMISIPAVKSEVYFNITPVSTFDVYFTEDTVANLALKYPRVARLLTAYREKQYASLNKIRTKSNALMFHLIIQIREALKRGLENEPSTLALVEELILMVMEEKPLKAKFQYNFNDVEKIHRAHRLIGTYLDEKDILKNKMQETKIIPAKFREGFKLFFGCLPNQYLHQKRMEKAHELAMEGRGTTVKDIAQLCGYVSSDHLSNKFLKYYGKRLSTILKEIRKKSK